MVIFSFFDVIVNNAGYRVSHYKEMSFDVVCFLTIPLVYLELASRVTMLIKVVVILVLPKRK